MNKLPCIAVVGAGASGLMAAVQAAKQAEKTNRQVKIILYDGNARAGKKILATGNGRCNLTNLNMTDKFYFGSIDSFNAVYPQFDNKALIDFFADTGMAVRSDAAGRVYPLSNQASSVLDALRYETERLGVEIVTETKITSIKKSGDGFLLNGEYYADKCILACGGKACPVHGSDGSGYALLKSLGIAVTDVFPALTAIEIKDFTKSLKGIRAEGCITVKSAGKVLARSRGELQYTDYGISGIPAMQVSRSISEMLCGGKKADIFVCVDSVPSMSADELHDFLMNIIRRNPSLPCEMLLAGLMPKRLGAYLLSEVSINPAKALSSVNAGAVDKVVAAVKNKKYRPFTVKGFNDAQITAGGADMNGFYADTLESKKLKGLFVCGELADVDGDCGGYNLQWAFSSGYVAGINAVRGLK